VDSDFIRKDSIHRDLNAFTCLRNTISVVIVVGVEFIGSIFRWLSF